MKRMVRDVFTVSEKILLNESKAKFVKKFKMKQDAEGPASPTISESRAATGPAATRPRAKDCDRAHYGCYLTLPSLGRTFGFLESAPSRCAQGHNYQTRCIMHHNPSFPSKYLSSDH